ncbi:MAG: F0F1 ATP synthase subunit delta [Treponema sp.]|jgi:F-type H+-transporting ATPase subunit delta|nr:F0F1 ATP synthase subunit delta [Treponema sp.]
MFRGEPWADAFVKSALRWGPSWGDGTESRREELFRAADLALEYLRIFCRSALSLPEDLAGRSDAERFGAVIAASLKRAAETSGPAFGQDGRGGTEGAGLPPQAELSRRFVMLMIMKGCFHHYKRIIRGIEQLLNRQRGVEEPILEAAADPDPALLAAAESKAREISGAREIRLTIRVIPGLMGGLRLRVGSRIFDGSLKTGLQKMAVDLGGLSAAAFAVDPAIRPEEA